MDQGHCQEIYPLIHSSITNEDPSAADVSPWSLGTRQAVVQVPPLRLVSWLTRGDTSPCLSPCASSCWAAALKHLPI